MFNYEGRLFRALSFFADMILLQLIWVVFSLPLVTIGASTTAAYYAAMKKLEYEEGHIWSNFIRGFRSNFAQSTKLWLIMVAASVVLAGDLVFSQKAGGVLGSGLMVFFTPFAVLVLFTLIYLFPIQSRFENTILQTLKNAFLMSIANIPYTILALILGAALAAVGFLIPQILIVVVLCGFGLYFGITSVFFLKIFKKYQ